MLFQKKRAQTLRAGGAGDPVVPQSSTSRNSNVSVVVDAGIIRTQHLSMKRVPEIEITGNRIYSKQTKLVLKGDRTIILAWFLLLRHFFIARIGISA